jgi:Mg2+ and Co2+ transporter CorA
MSLTTSPTDPAPSGVKLRCARIVVWNDGQRAELDAADLPSEYVERAAAAAEPIWVQLLLPRLSEDQQAWFEGSVDPWQELEEPELDWTDVHGVLDALGIGPFALDPHERRLLERLPYLYVRGVARVAREVWGARSNAPAQLRFFPTVAFRPMTEDPPRFWTVRATVGVIRNVVVSVRLPDLWWNDESERFDYTRGKALDVAQRFFPSSDDLTADDVAEAIGLQQASTARAVSENIRSRLTQIERASRREVGSSGRRDRKAKHDNASRVLDMTDTLYQLDRQLERLLRRVELNASDVLGQASSSDIAVRYRFALDELRSLEGNSRLASEAIQTAERAEREHFEFVAAIIASVILVPTLVATIYGANVKLPAEETWEGFAALAGSIVVCGVLALFLVRRMLPRQGMHGATVSGGLRDRLTRISVRRDDSGRRDDQGDTTPAPPDRPEPSGRRLGLRVAGPHGRESR